MCDNVAASSHFDPLLDLVTFFTCFPSEDRAGRVKTAVPKQHFPSQPCSFFHDHFQKTNPLFCHDAE